MILTKCYLELTAAPEEYPLGFEERFGFGASQHGQRAEHAGLSAGVRRDRDRFRGVGNRPACPGIEDMAVANTIFHKKAARITAGGESSALQGKGFSVLNPASCAGSG